MSSRNNEYAAREIVTTRVVHAPRERVFRAWTDPATLARWWGPAGFTNRFDIFEFETGGRWVFTMIGPDGTSYPNESRFTSIEADRKVVIRHVVEPHFELAITLEPSAGGWSSQPPVFIARVRS